MFDQVLYSISIRVFHLAKQLLNNGTRSQRGTEFTGDKIKKPQWAHWFSVSSVSIFFWALRK